MKRYVIFTALVLAAGPMVFAGNNAGYPTSGVAQFVVDKTDVTSLPSSLRPKKEKGKKTLADYGFTSQLAGADAVTIMAANGSKLIEIKVLDQNSSGIFVCISEPGSSGSEAKAQSVVLLKRNDSSALLKTHLTFREFASCPAVGSDDSSSSY